LKGLVRERRHGDGDRNIVPQSDYGECLPLKYFALAFAWFFWRLQLLAVRNAIPALPGLKVIGTLGPMLAAVIITAHESGRVGVRTLLSRIVRWRVAPVWYAVAILGPLVLTLAATPCLILV
jgi:hypothetical protein